MVEETAAASTQMMAQIRELEGELARFQGHGAPPPEGAVGRVPARRQEPPRRQGGDGPKAVVAYDRRSANTGYQVVLNEAPSGPLN
jgi:hypothetical protein